MSPTESMPTIEAPAPMSREWLEARITAEGRELARVDREREARRKRLAFLAATRWVMERQAEVIILADGLPRKPAVIGAKLRTSSHGCDWLIARWKMLQRVTAGRPFFHPAERTLAQDLLATPAELRDSGTLDPRFLGMPIAEVIQSQIDELEALKASGLEELDGMDRAAAIEGQDVFKDRSLAALNREAAACQRRIQWAIKRLEADERAARRRPPEKAIEVPIEQAGEPATRESSGRRLSRSERRRRHLDRSNGRPLGHQTPITTTDHDAIRARLRLPVEPSVNADLLATAGV